MPLDVAASAHWADLAAALAGGEDRPRLFYLATSPDLFGPICAGCWCCGHRHARRRGWCWKSRSAATSPRRSGSTTRSAGSSASRRSTGSTTISGKESVQNLLALRFANSLFESVWDRAHIDHVQITVAETVGVEERAAYYDKSGALRDMVQNHILQLLCLVAMEPPTSMAADSVRDEKLKVLRSLRAARPTARPLHEDRARPVPRRRRRRHARCRAMPRSWAHASRTETFVALKAEVENWRWAGVPFYLRTGKRLPTRVSEIVIQFHKVPHSIFPRRRRADRAQPPGHPAAARRRHPARADGQGPGPGRHAAAQRPRSTSASPTPSRSATRTPMSAC